MPTILISDDSMFQRFMFSKVAKEQGFTVLEAKDGLECLKLAVEHKPDVMLLDLNMPGMTGHEVLQHLADDDVHAKVLVITADIQETTKQRCLELGVSGFLNKPVAEEDLVQAINNL